MLINPSRLVLLVWLAAAFFVHPRPCPAQEGAFAFLVKGGAALPLSGFRSPGEGWEGEASAGPSVSMAFTFPLPGPVDAYLGFGQYRFGCDETVCPAGSDWASTGFDVGVRWVAGRRRVRPWVQAGVHSARVEGKLTSTEGPAERISDRGTGFEAGGGVLVAVGERTSVSSGVRYGRLDADFSKVGTLGLEYLILDFGLVLGF